MGPDGCAACPKALFHDAAKMVGDLVDEAIPPEAFVHLHNAEKEILLAIAVTFTYHAEMRAKAARESSSAAEARPGRRPVKITLDD